MSRVFITGDKHADFNSPDDYKKIEEFCKRHGTTRDDYMIVLGDHGMSYFGGWRDIHAKEKLAKIPIRFIMIRGNHDERPSMAWKHIYVDTAAVTGWFIEDPDFPDILYTEEYGWYKFAGVKAFVINGAYSVDKDYRIAMHSSGWVDYKWFADEQLSGKEMNDAHLKLIDHMREGPFVVMSHTCPISFKPFDKIDGADETMEAWMDKLYDDTIKLCPNNLKQWYCGHWHIDRFVDPVRFMYHDILEVRNAN